jgi:hypothetical protein
MGTMADSSAPGCICMKRWGRSGEAKGTTAVTGQPVARRHHHGHACDGVWQGYARLPSRTCDPWKNGVIRSRPQAGQVEIVSTKRRGDDYALAY